MPTPSESQNIRIDPTARTYEGPGPPPRVPVTLHLPTRSARLALA